MVARVLDDLIAVVIVEIGKATLDILTAEVGSHDDDGVLEVHRAPLVISKSSVVKYLQEDVEHIGMSFFDFVEEHHTVRFATYSLSELTTFIVTYVPRRCTNETRDTELLLVLTHINTGHHILIVEQILGKCLCQLRLTCTRRTEEDERRDRTSRILQASTRPADGVSHCLDGLVLTNNPLVELVLNMQELLTLTLHHAGYRYASPPAHHFGNIVGGHLLTNHCLTTLRSLELQLNIGNVIIEFLQLAIAYLSHTAVISLTLSFLGFEFEILDLLLVLLNLIHKTFLSLPFCTERVFFLFVLSNLFVELFDLILVALALNSLALNLDLFQMTRDLVQFLRH